MGILDTLKEIKKEGFDPKKSTISSNDRLAAGDYPVRLKSAQAGMDKLNRPQIAINLEVVSGDNKNRLETIYLAFDDELPAFVLEKNGRTILKVAAMVGIEFSTKDLEDEYTAAEKLAKGIGKQFLMKLKIAENKKNPAYPYRNYEFDFLASEKPADFEIEDDDFPF